MQLPSLFEPVDCEVSPDGGHAMGDVQRVEVALVERLDLESVGRDAGPSKKSFEQLSPPIGPVILTIGEAPPARAVCSPSPLPLCRSGSCLHRRR